MNGKAMSLAQVRRVEMAALLQTLGTAGMVRFLQQEETGEGDYSIERHQWLDAKDVASLAEQIRRSRPSAPPPSG